jgi:hypothetical protein
MNRTNEDEDGTMDDPGRDGWIALLLIVVICLLAVGRHYGIAL